MTKIILIVLGTVVFIFAIIAVGKTAQKIQEETSRGGQPSGFPRETSQSKQSEDKFIVANPLDLSEIASLSKFRSCIGHDYSGKNTKGEVESNRSMKHYVTVKQNVEKAKALAPFDGKVISIELPERGYQVWLRPDTNPNFAFIFFHVETEVKKGDKVKAGQRIGYGVTAGAANFDMGLKGLNSFGGPKNFDSPLNHMANSVLAEYKQKGITLENIIMSKEERDKNPCTFGQGNNQNEQVFLK